MQRLTALIARFARDERGVFAVLFGVMAIVLVALGGAVVDYVTLEQTRTRAQVALDAAVLALQPRIFDANYDENAVRDLAQAMMIERIGDNRVTATIDRVETSVDDGSLYFHARFTMPTTFVALVGVPELGAAVQSEATRKKLALEVVMVLDNSASMQQESRMTNLVAAARCATYILMYSEVQDSGNTCIPAPGATLVEDVRVGIVPFTMYVNVGAGNANQPWIDRFGQSPLSAQNFDNDDNDATAFVGPVNRLALYDNISNENWRGCVEARPHIATSGANGFLDTDDTPPTPGQPATLFVPLFAPDLPETITTLASNNNLNNYAADHPAACRVTGVCKWTETKRTCSNYNNCSGSTTNTYSWVSGRDRPTSCTCASGGPFLTDTGTGNYTTSNGSRTYTRERTCNFQYDAVGLSNKELQERLCKYTGNLPFITDQKGPNADCPQQAILPLTDNPAQVINAIDNMVALGGTNIHEGTAWGFRALSPGAPFDQGAPYDEATSKVLIVMTDGENTAYNLSNYCSSSAQRSLNGSCYYSAYGYPSNHTGATPRMGPLATSNANLVNQMNERTLQTCANAKAEGITLYTVGLATNTVTQSTEAVVRAMLTNCASTSDRARFPSRASDLKETFTAIANDLSALRLAR